MLTISSANKDRITGGQVQLVTLNVTLADNTSVSLYEGDIMQGTFTIDRATTMAGEMPIGAATAAELKFTIGDYNGTYRNTDFNGARIDADLCLNINGTRTKVCDLGRYDVITARRDGRLISITAYDLMNRLNGMLTRAGEGGYTITMATILQNIGNQAIGSTSFIDYSAVSSLLTTPTLAKFRYPSGQDVTLHNMVSWCAALSGSIARAHGNADKIQLVRGETTGVVITSSNRYSGRCDEKDVALTGINCYDANGKAYSSGSAGYELEIESNGVFEQAYNQDTGADYRQTIVNNLWNALRSFRFRPFKASTLPMPWLEVGDAISYKDDDGVTHGSIVTHIRFVLNGKMTIECNCANETEHEIDSVTPAGIKRSSIATEMLRLNALKSINYVDADGNFSGKGTFFDLAKGLIKSKNFGIDENGNAYFKGTINAQSGHVGNAQITTAAAYGMEGTGLLLTSSEDPSRQVFVFPNEIFVRGGDNTYIALGFEPVSEDDDTQVAYVSVRTHGGENDTDVGFDISEGAGRLYGTWTLNNRLIKTE